MRSAARPTGRFAAAAASSNRSSSQGLAPRRPVHHGARPVHIVAPALERPVGRRARGHGPQVARLVRQLEQLGARAARRRVHNLQALALRLGQRLVVGGLGDQARHVLAERRRDLRQRRVGVLDDVVEEGRGDEARILPTRRLGHQVGDLGQMVEVGLGGIALAALMRVALGREVERPCQQLGGLARFAHMLPSDPRPRRYPLASRAPATTARTTGRQ